MPTIKYPSVVNAARLLGLDKKTLAEALYESIPPRKQGRTKAGTPTIEDQLAEAAAEIKRETGETYSASTLRDYRDIATWAASGNSGGTTGISWADASWTAHYEAYKRGLPWDQFVGGKRTKRAVRTQLGRPTGDVPAAARAINQEPAEAAKLVQDMTPAARRAVRTEIEKADVESTHEAVRNAGGDPDLIHPFPGELKMEAIGIRNRWAYTRADINNLRKRCEPDQWEKEVLPELEEGLSMLTQVVYGQVPDNAAALEGGEQR